MYSIENNWKFLKYTITEAAKLSAGYLQKKNKPWISEKTRAKIHERKLTKQKLLMAKVPPIYEKTKRHYDRLEKEVKIYARKDKALYIEELTTEAEKAAKTGNSKSLFNIMKQLCNKPPKTNIPIKDKNAKH
jgi:hypothetical protein